MFNKDLILDKLMEFQAIAQEEVETREDIRVYNFIGLVIAMIRNDLILLDSLFVFVETISALNEEEKNKVHDIMVSAFANVTLNELEEEDTNEEESN
jgi:hypothetical protein